MCTCNTHVFQKKINLVGTGMGSQEDIWIFKIEFARLTSFDPQFASLSKYNPLLANCFSLPIFFSFSRFLTSLFRFQFIAASSRRGRSTMPSCGRAAMQ